MLKEAVRVSRSAFLAVGVFSFFANLSALAVPLYMLQVFTRVLSSRSETTLVMLTLLIGFLLLVFTLLDIARSWVLGRVANKLDLHFNPTIFDAIFERSVHIPGGAHGQAVRDLDTLRQFVAGRALFAFFDAPWVPIFLLILFLFHPVIGVIAIVGGLILLALGLLNEFQSRNAYSKISGDRVEASNYADASLRNSEVIKAMGMLGSIRRIWRQKHETLLATQTQIDQQTNTIFNMAKFVRLILQILVMGTGAYYVLQQKMTPGSMIAASILMGRALMPMEQAVGQWRAFGVARTAYSRLQELLDHLPERRAQMTLPTPRGGVQVEKLVAAPPGANEALFKGIGFNLAPGESLGVFGPSGAGKSTLARLLVGVWPTRAGAVRLDGVDVFDWDSEQLGPHIGYLPQDVELFDGTVAENIARFQEVDADAVVAAARAAGLHDTILHLPKGYDTRIGQAGGVLSGGQRQRVGLARALFGSPALIILDEPNSNLDAEGDRALLNCLRALKERGATVIVISHRPNLLGVMDKLMFLRGGAIEAFGPREKVMKAFSGPTVSNLGGAAGMITP